MNDTNNISSKNYHSTLFLCFFFGILGVHRFYTGKLKSGFLMLLTCGGVGIWFLIDLITILLGKFKDNTELVIISNKPFYKTWSNYAVITIIITSITINTLYQDNIIKLISGFNTNQSAIEENKNATKNNFEFREDTYYYFISNSLVLADENKTSHNYVYSLPSNTKNLYKTNDYPNSNIREATITSQPYYVLITSLYGATSDDLDWYCNDTITEHFDSFITAETSEEVTSKQDSDSCYSICKFTKNGVTIYESVEFIVFDRTQMMIKQHLLSSNITYDEFYDIFFETLDTTTISD